MRKDVGFWVGWGEGRGEGGNEGRAVGGGEWVVLGCRYELGGRRVVILPSSWVSSSFNLFVFFLFFFLILNLEDLGFFF